jgi:hypothetical protein
MKAKFKFKVCINFKSACDLQKVAGHLHYYKSAYPALDKIKNKLIRVFGHNVFEIIKLDWETVEKLCLALIKAYDRSFKNNPVFEIESGDGIIFIIRELDDDIVYRVISFSMFSSELFKPEEIKDEDFINVYNSED